MKQLGIFVATIFFLLSMLHVYWVFNGTAGSSAFVPEINGKRQFNPTPLATTLVAIALLTAATIILGRIGYFASILPKWVFTVGTFGISIVFLLRAIGNFSTVGFFKHIVDSKFAYWDTVIFSPLCLIIALSTALIALLAD